MKSEDPVKSARIQCPACRRPVGVLANGALKHPKFFPFCSERCKLIDLGTWLDAGYRISSRPDEASDEPPMDTTVASDPAP